MASRFANIILKKRTTRTIRPLTPGTTQLGVYVINCLFFSRNARNFWQVLIGMCIVGFSCGGYLAMMSIIGIVLTFIVKRPMQEVGGE